MIDINKIINIILYMLHKKVKYLNDKKILIILFLIDYNHLLFCKKKITNELYIKDSRHPQALLLTELFDIIANNEKLDSNDEKSYLIQEIYDNLKIKINKKESYIELNFEKIEDDFDKDIFLEEEIKTIHKIVSNYKDLNSRKLANECFKIEKFRNVKKGDIII